MSDTRFDELARLLGRGASRRQVLKGLAGSALAAALSAIGVSEAGAQPGCRQEGHPCEGNQVCCPGLVCMVTGPGNAQRCARPAPPKCGPCEIYDHHAGCCVPRRCENGCCPDGCTCC